MAFSHYFLFVCFRKKDNWGAKSNLCTRGPDHKPSLIKGQLLPFDREKAIGPFWQLSLGWFLLIFVCGSADVSGLEAGTSEPAQDLTAGPGDFFPSPGSSNFSLHCHRNLHAGEDQPSEAFLVLEWLPTKLWYGRVGPAPPNLPPPPWHFK